MSDPLRDAALAVLLAYDDAGLVHDVSQGRLADAIVVLRGEAMLIPRGECVFKLADAWHCVTHQSRWAPGKSRCDAAASAEGVA